MSCQTSPSNPLYHLPPPHTQQIHSLLPHGHLYLLTLKPLLAAPPPPSPYGSRLQQLLVGRARNDCGRGQANQSMDSPPSWPSSAHTPSLEHSGRHDLPQLFANTWLAFLGRKIVSYRLFVISTKRKSDWLFCNGCTVSTLHS